jgi:hypothetical protein
MEIVGLAGLVAIIWKLVDFARFVTNAAWSSAVTQLSVWLSAIAVALLAREAEPFSTIGVVGTTFGELNTAAIVLFALGLGSTASTLVDVKQAIDHSDSAAVPPLLPERHVSEPD